jgi:hypothetical protein
LQALLQINLPNTKFPKTKISEKNIGTISPTSLGRIFDNNEMKDNKKWVAGYILIDSDLPLDNMNCICPK